MADLVGGSIVWNLDVNDKAFNQGIDEAKSKVKDLGDETESSGRKIIPSESIKSWLLEWLNKLFWP